MITTNRKITLIGGDDKVVNFLEKYGAFERDAAIDYSTEYPTEASELVDKIRNSILNDKTISEEYKNKIKQI